MEGKFHVAHFRDLRRIFKGLVAAGKQGSELFFAFQIKLLGLKAHPVQVVHGLSGLDAQQDVLHVRILFPQVMGIVGHHQRQSRLPGQPHEPLVHRALGGNAVVLEL